MPKPLNWGPGANGDQLRARAALLEKIRAFFNSRNILEVETPLLCSSGITDPSIEPLLLQTGVSVNVPRYLQTSPEYAMKRLLASGTGPIFQVCKAFRDDEAGARHNPEFSLLEWYRPGFDHHQLMTEVAELVCECLGPQTVQRFSYRDLFRRYLDMDPFAATPSELETAARDKIDVDFSSCDQDLWLDLIMSHIIEPELADQGLVFVYDYPASQAALACIAIEDGVETAQRFELYVNGIELANGYRELTDASEQRSRFVADNERRSLRGQPERPLDELLLAAMGDGLAPCSGVALGIDRMLMLATGASDIRDVLAFDWSRS